MLIGIVSNMNSPLIILIYLRLSSALIVNNNLGQCVIATISSTAKPPDMRMCKLKLSPKYYSHFCWYLLFFISKWNKCYIIVHTIGADILWIQWYRQIDLWYANLSSVSFQLCYYLKTKIMAYLEVFLYILVLVNVVCPKVSNNSYSDWCFLGHTWWFFILRNY